MNDVALNELSISFPDFKLNEIINPDEFDTNNSEIVNKINALIEVMNKITDSTTDGDSGADNVAVTLIDGYTATKLQPLLEEIVAKLTSTTDGFSGADYIKATTIEGLTGTSVQSLLESLKAVHDALIATANTNASNAVNTANLANSTAETANTNATNAVNTANSADSKADDAVAIANQASETANNAYSKAEQVEDDYNTLKPVLEQAVVDAENAVESVAQKVDKSYVDEIAANFVLGIVPDGTITEEKLHPDVVEKLNDTYDDTEVRESIEAHLNDDTQHIYVDKNSPTTSYKLVVVDGRPYLEVVSV